MDFKKVASFFLAMAMTSGLSGFDTYAAEKTENGVKLVISADKESYGADDKIVANVSVENNSGSDITDISLESVIPENYRFSDGDKAVRRATYIRSGESMKAEFVFLPDVKESSTQATEERSEAAKAAETLKVQESSAATSSPAVNESTEENTDSSEFNVKLLIVILLVLALAVGGVVVIVRKKGKKNGIMILLCITAAGLLDNGQNVKAVDTETHTISVGEAVTISGKEYELTATVRFTMDIPDMQAAVEEYYEENSEEIVSVEEVKEDENVFTEKEAIKFMADRGFTDYPLTYDFNMDGAYTDEAEASADSEEKHPMYQTLYAAENGSVWTIFIVGKTIAANPASYNLQSDIDAQVLVSETATLTSYTEAGNKFYETVPKESAVILKVVDKITSKKINELTYEEVFGR